MREEYLIQLKTERDIENWIYDIRTKLLINGCNTKDYTIFVDPNSIIELRPRLMLSHSFRFEKASLQQFCGFNICVHEHNYIMIKRTAKEVSVNGFTGDPRKNTEYVLKFSL